MTNIRQIKEMIMTMIKPLQNRIMMTISRGVLEAVKDDNKLQLLKLSLLADEQRDNIERFQQYGFTSNPLPGAECIALFPGGNRDHGIVIAVDDRRFRLKALKSGEVALYTDEGDKIHFKRADAMGKTKIVIHSDNIELGEGSLKALVNSDFLAKYDTHTHASFSAPPVPVSISDDTTSTTKAN